MRFENFDVGEENRNLRGKFMAFALVFNLLVRPATTGFVWNSGGKDWKTKDRPFKTLNPTFEETETRIVTIVGRDVVLPCRIISLNDKVVSWIRTRDLHIITSGSVIFTADDRFDCDRDPNSSDWSLRLRNSRPEDSGDYECQVNTDPKMSRKITLDVVSDLDLFGDSPSKEFDFRAVGDEGEFPRKGVQSRILGKEEQFVKMGSTITFTCVVIASGEPVTSVEWLKNGRRVSFQASRGGIIVETERLGKKATSRLTLADVEAEDAGNYTCKPGNGKSHSVTLVAVEGERTQAMQRHKNGSERFFVDWTPFLTSLFLSCLSFR